MTEQIKDVNAKIDEAEEAIKKYASKDTVISIGGYEFTPAKLMVAFTLVSSILGGLYGTFEVYKDYQGMKKKIADYVSPDLTEIYKKLAIIDETNSKTSDYTRDIKNDLKNDIRRLEGVTENVERSTKQTARETDLAVKEARDEVRQVRKEAEQTARNLERDVNTATKNLEKEIDRRLKNSEKEIDQKIQKALDNPLSK